MQEPFKSKALHPTPAKAFKINFSHQESLEFRVVGLESSGSRELQTVALRDLPQILESRLSVFVCASSERGDPPHALGAAD